MNQELESYKKLCITQLTKVYNSQITLIFNNLNSNIRYISGLRITIRIKMQRINVLKNIYYVTVNNLKTKFASDIKAVNLLTEIPDTLKPKKNALLVGINYKGSPNELYGCINDTNNIKTLLQDRFAFKNYLFLTDDTNKKPTKQNIITELTNLLVNAVSGDTLFFLYSGHGTCTTDLNGDELDSQDELIVPIDATSIQSCILDDELNKIIQTNIKNGVKLFLLFDSCFSGTVLDLKYNYLDYFNNPNVLETLGQVIMISGCMDNQTSADAYVNYNGKNTSSGAMTFAFLKTIQELGTNISLKTLIESMRSLLKNNGYDQVPQLSSGKAIDINTLLPLYL
jgi:hypothetical protein